SCLFIFHAPSTTEFYTLSLHDALPIWGSDLDCRVGGDRGGGAERGRWGGDVDHECLLQLVGRGRDGCGEDDMRGVGQPRISSSPDRKSTRLNSSHVAISYAVFCLKKKK